MKAKEKIDSNAIDLYRGTKEADDQICRMIDIRAAEHDARLGENNG